METKIGPKHLCMLHKQIFQSESELGKHFCQCGLPNSSDNGKKNKKNFCSPARKIMDKGKKLSLQDNEQRKEIEENSNNTNTGFQQRKETEENSNNAKKGILTDTSEQSDGKTHELKCEVCEKQVHSVTYFSLHVDICKKVNLACKKCAKKWKSLKHVSKSLESMQ